MYKDEKDGKEVIVCVVGSTTLLYDARCLEDLHAMLKAHGDWMDLGGADEQKEAKAGTVEAWGRSESNPVGGWYGLKKGLRGRFGVYVPPLMEALGLAELTHEAKKQQNARHLNFSGTFIRELAFVYLIPKGSSTCLGRHNVRHHAQTSRALWQLQDLHRSAMKVFFMSERRDHEKTHEMPILQRTPRHFRKAPCRN